MLKALKRKLSKKSSSHHATRTAARDAGASRPVISEPTPNNTNSQGINLNITSPSVVTKTPDPPIPVAVPTVPPKRPPPPQVPPPLRSILRQKNAAPSDPPSDSDTSTSESNSASGSGGGHRSVAFLDQDVIGKERLQQMSTSIRATLLHSGNIGIQRRSFADDADFEPIPDYPTPAHKTHSFNGFELDKTRHRVPLNPTSTFQPAERSDPIGRPKKGRAPNPPGMSLVSIKENGGGSSYNAIKKLPAPVTSNQNGFPVAFPGEHAQQVQCHPPGHFQNSSLSYNSSIRSAEYDTRTLTPGSSTETLHNQQSHHLRGDSSNHVAQLTTNPPVGGCLLGAPASPTLLRERGDGDSQEDESTSSGSVSHERSNHKISEIHATAQSAPVILDSRKLRSNSSVEQHQKPQHRQPGQMPKSRSSVIIEKSDVDSSVVMECKSFEPYVHQVPIVAPSIRRFQLQSQFNTLPSKPVISVRPQFATNMTLMRAQQPVAQQLPPRTLPIQPIPSSSPPDVARSQKVSPKKESFKRITSSLSKAFSSRGGSNTPRSRNSIGSTFELSTFDKGDSVSQPNRLAGSAYDLSKVEMSFQAIHEPKRDKGKHQKNRPKTVADPWRDVAARSHENLHTVNPGFNGYALPSGPASSFHSQQLLQSPRAAAAVGDPRYYSQSLCDDVNNSQYSGSEALSSRRASSMYTIS